jgi:hypothetical protein
MNNIIGKVLLFLSIIVIVVAISTPNWEQSKLLVLGTITQDTHFGLFRYCTKGLVNTCSHTVDALSDEERGKAVKHCQGLAFSSVIFLALGLILLLLPGRLEYKWVKIDAMISLVVGVVLAVACISLFSHKVHLISVNSSIGSAKESYGYSFYLAISGLLLAAVGGGITIYQHKEMF